MYNENVSSQCYSGSTSSVYFQESPTWQPTAPHTGSYSGQNTPAEQYQITRDPALKADVNSLQRSMTHQLNKWRNDQWNKMLEMLDPKDQSLWKINRRVMESSHSLTSPVHSGLSQTPRNLKPWLSLEAPFQLVNDPPEQVVTEMVDIVLWAYSFTPAREA